MKKILRLVTTSVLTLTLVACGGQSSASSQSSTQSSSSTGTTTSSSSSAYAAVSSVSISAASSLLEQVSTSIKKVTVSATLNANTNPNTAIEWYIDGAKSIQSGKIFEFTPSGVGSFQVVAKVGSVSSNTIEVKVSAPEAVITIESVKVIDADTIEVKGSEGATIEIVGKTLKDQSYYDFIAKKYVLDVKEAIAQGDKLTVKLSKDGASKTMEYTYDTRVFEVEDIANAVKGADGSYTVTKPFAPAGEPAFAYAIDLATDNIVGKGMSFSAVTNVPAGATAVNTLRKEIDVADEDSIVAGQYTITKDTVVGDYTHIYKLGTKEVEVLIHVVEPTSSLGLKKGSYVIDDITTVAKEKFDVQYKHDENDDGDILDADDVLGVVANADGSYTITRPYETKVNGELKFDFFAKYFAKNEYVDNTFNIAVTGPSLFGGANAALVSGIETKADGTSDPLNDDCLKMYETFNAAAKTGLAQTVTQVISSQTPVGKYTFTLSTSASSEVASVVINVVAPTASIVSEVSSVEDTTNKRVVDYVFDEASNTYTFEKPLNASTYTYSYKFELNNFQSSAASDADVIADQTTIYDYPEFQRKVFNFGPGTYNGYAVFAENTTPYKGAYSATATYAVGDYVLEAGKYYECTTAIATGEVFTVGKWTELVSPAGAVKLAAIAKKIAYDAENIDLSKVTSSSVNQLRVFTPYTFTTVSEEDGVKTLSGKAAIQLVSHKDEIVAKTANVEVNKNTVAGSYSYALSYLKDGVEYKSVINVEIKNPTPKVFVLSGSKTSATATSSSTGGEGYQCIQIGATVTDVVCSTDGVYNVDVADATQLVGVIGIADIPAGTYPYSVTKEYPDASKNLQSSGEVKVISSYPTGYMNMVPSIGYTETQAAALPFADAWEIDEGKPVKGTYHYTFLFAGVTKEITINVGDFKAKLLINSASVDDVPMETMGSEDYYVYDSSALTVAADVVLSLSAVNVPAGTELWVGITDGQETKLIATELAATTLKVAFDEEGKFEYTVTGLIPATADYAHEVKTQKIYLYTRDATDATKLAILKDSVDEYEININVLDLKDGKVANPA